MTATTAGTLKKTPLHARHLALGARMTGFGGWEMPLEYSGISDEHNAVRTRAGLFDVSHMGEIEVAGADAIAALQRIATNDVARLQVGQAQYSLLTTREGTIIDDLLVYRLAPDHFLLVVNAAFIEKDFAWISGELADAGDVVAFNASARYALVALQGPRARDVLQPLTGVDLAGIKYYWFATGEVAAVRSTISRTGYTGEDGYEVFVPPHAAPAVWDAILAAGRDAGLVPVGLGARDTLRLEAGMRLSGTDMDETTSVLEAGLDRFVAWQKGEFNGRAALERQRQEGPLRRLAGFEMIDRAIARHGYDVYLDDRKVGIVTSGTQTPFLKKAIGLAYLPADRATPGTECAVDVRGRHARARVIPLPFYTRPRSQA